jgi:hypothetical protein
MCFSGKKGFSVEIKTTERFTPEEVKAITLNLAEGLTTVDHQIYNASRVFRIPNTKHQTTGLYKIPLSFSQLSELDMNAIITLAKEANAENWNNVEVELPDNIIQMAKLSTSSITPIQADLGQIDYNRRHKTMPACKYTIQEGYFGEGERNHCLTIMAAHYKAQGMHKEVTQSLLKGISKIQHERHPNEKEINEEEIRNIINSVYSIYWKGGTYSCKTDPVLKKLCPKGPHNCENKRKNVKEPVTIDAIKDTFSSYAKDIDKNTVQIGIPELDQAIRLQTKTHVVIAATAGVGKTSLVLNILNNTSKKNIKSLFGSMDMSDALIYQKLAHKVSGISSNELYNIYKKDIKKKEEIDRLILENYKNVFFDFRGGVSIETIENTLRSMKEQHGPQFKLAVFDYINLIHGPYSDATANLNLIAPRLKDLANELSILIISLAQVGRDKGAPNTPLKSSRVAKGSSAIEESATVLFGMWRYGYNTDNDNFITIAGLKTRMGKEFIVDMHWNGLRAEIRGLTEEEKQDLEILKSDIENNKKKDPFG